MKKELIKAIISNSEINKNLLAELILTFEGNKQEQAIELLMGINPYVGVEIPEEVTGIDEENKFYTKPLKRIGVDLLGGRVTYRADYYLFECKYYKSQEDADANRDYYSYHMNGYDVVVKSDKKIEDYSNYSMSIAEWLKLAK